MGFTLSRPCHVHGDPNCNWWHEELGLEIYNHNDTGEWLWVECDRVSMRLRGDLFRLMTWLEAGK